MTNYQYASNEPIANVDMDGLEKAQVLDPIVIFKDMGHNAANAFEKTMSNLIPLASKAINLASSVVQSQIANKSLNENLADQITKNVFNYYQENRNSMSLSDLWVLNNLSQNYYAGLNGMAWWRKTDFIKLQQNVSNSTLSPEQKIQLVELEIQKSQEEWGSVMQSGANASLFISSLGLFPGMGLSPKSTLLKFGAQQTSARTSSIFSHITRKIAKQMSRRGWTRKLIHETVNNPFTTRSATNRATGNAATAYFRKNGSYVVKDNVTNEIIQISNRLDSHWVPDATIVNPYIP